MIFFKKIFSPENSLRGAIDAAYRMDETQCVQQLISQLQFTSNKKTQIKNLARQYIENVRARVSKSGGVEALMMHYDLSTEEGIVLMSLAEALLRIPDKETRDLLIRDKLTSADWDKHIGASESSFVNIASWGLAITGKILKYDEKPGPFKKIWSNLIRRSGEPVIRKAIRSAIALLSEQFVLGRTIEEAIKNSQQLKGYEFSYDMLGEVARTQEDADRYFAAYQYAIDAIGRSANGENIFHGPSISIKLSALYPRYEFFKRELAVPYLTDRLKTLVLQAHKYNMSVTIDAEEADRLDMMLDIFSQVFADEELKDWHGLGLAVQAYQKRALPVIQWLIDLARKHKKKIPVRLVKGAYWDTEIKISQYQAYENYPVFTRKASTDVSYLACAKIMLNAQDVLYPQFATHNAYSAAAILSMMGDKQAEFDYEFQSLQGMGKALHDQLLTHSRCRIYAPVGKHEDLLPYLVRRLLENGANSSFVNKIADKNIPVDTLLRDPVDYVSSLDSIPNPKIPLPKDIYGSDRLNSRGLDFSHYQELQEIEQQMEPFFNKKWFAASLNKNKMEFRNDASRFLPITNPANRNEIVGEIVEANNEEVDQALLNAEQAFTKWNDLGFEKRAEIMDLFSFLLEEHRAELMSLIVREAGRTIPNALGEIREAVDFCRYYAMLARHYLKPKTLPGPTGESNVLMMYGRGTIVSISPWNFPLAIFTGQMVAGLVTGNCVIVKPAEQTPLIAARIVELAHEAGVPKPVLQLMIGRGEVVGAALVADPRVTGVLFTGSTETAKHIQKTLTQKPGPIPLLIAETGGLNVMIADSSALPEQIIADTLTSAFDSAGQRCSALRILCVQDEIADRVITMLHGAMKEMIVNDPRFLATDVGPAIDQDACKGLIEHQKKMEQEAELIYRVPLNENNLSGSYFPPQAYLIKDFHLIKREVFGPILHVLRFKAEELDELIQSINALGYGLTFGIQSRIDNTIDRISKRIRAGNIYVNRNMIGAVVGVQPFGGSRLSGTGPKAGGPHYLSRLCEEKTVTINTSAVGGNTSLLASSE